MKALCLLAVLAAAPALAEDTMPPTVKGNQHFRAYERGLPVGADAGARVVTFRSVDHDRDGLWEPHEIAAHFVESQRRDLLLAFDGNGDGCISLLELRAFDDGGTGGPDGLLKERVRG